MTATDELGLNNAGKYVGLRQGEYWERTENSNYYCGGCGWKVTDHDRFCPECGGAFRECDASNLEDESKQVSITDELRSWADGVALRAGMSLRVARNRAHAIADRIDAEHEKATRELSDLLPTAMRAGGNRGGRETTVIERLLEVSNKLWDAMYESGEVPTYAERAHYYLALKDAMDENAELREQGARLFDKTLELGTENAKLREYLQMAVRIIDVAVEKSGYNAHQDELEKMHKEMRELGIEVSE